MATYPRWYRKADAWVLRSTSTPDPPPSTDVIYGASSGANNAATYSQLHPKIVRTFSPSPWSAFPDTRIWHSAKPTVATIADSASAGYTALRNSLRTEIAGLSDIPGHMFTVWHEMVDDENNPQVSSAQYVPMCKNVKTDVVDYVNASRTNPILFGGIINGDDAHASVGDAYYVPLVGYFDFFGADFYTLADLSAGISWFQAKGFPAWAIGELGDQVADPGHTDAEVVTFMNSAVAAIDAAWIPPIAVSWFNNLENCLVTRTTAAVSVGATSFTVANGFAPSGSSVIIGTGANAETVTIGSYTTSGQTRTFTCSAMSKAHASQVPVFLRPNSYNTWLPLIQASP